MRTGKQKIYMSEIQFAVHVEAINCYCFQNALICAFNITDFSYVVIDICQTKK